MTQIASVHLPPKASSAYVRIELKGETVGFLRANVYDQVFTDQAAYEEAMEQPGAEEEAHSKADQWVVRLRGEAALRAPYRHLSARDE